MDIRSKIVAHVMKEFKDRFRVFDNTGESKKVVMGQFPDLILMRKEPPPNSDVLFLMKVDNGEDFVNNLPEWQALSSTTSVLYVLVPKSKRDDAHKFISTTGVRARIGSYEIDGDEIKKINYE